MANAAVFLSNASLSSPGFVQITFDVYTDTGLGFSGNPFQYAFGSTVAENLEGIRQAAIAVIAGFGPGAPALQSGDVVVFMMPN